VPTTVFIAVAVENSLNEDGYYKGEIFDDH
jgi:hypothetical protein